MGASFMAEFGMAGSHAASRQGFSLGLDQLLRRFQLLLGEHRPLPVQVPLEPQPARRSRSARVAPQGRGTPPRRAAGATW